MHALRTFICARLLPNLETHQNDGDAAQAWLEKATVAYILFYTRQSDLTPGSSLHDLRDFLDTINGGLGSPFSPQATHAAQTLLWKASGQSDLGHPFEWGTLLRHPLFENAGLINKARIGR